MQAHANDLRSEVEKNWPTLVDDVSGVSSAAHYDAFVHQAVTDWRACPLRLDVARLLEHAEKLTLAPATCQRSDVEQLKESGWSDVAIHDAVQVVAYFNYINRIADALGVEPESDLPDWGEAGHDSLAARP